MDRLTGRRRAAVMISVLAVMGVLAVLSVTRPGAGTSPDSVGYLRMARRLLDGAAPGGQFPPLFPALLALPDRVGIEAWTTARWLNALLFGANIGLMGTALAGSFPDAAWPGVAGALLFLISPALVGLHAMVWSEPLFLFLTFSSVLALSRWIATPRRSWLLASAVLAALALLARYVGLALVVTGALGIIWLGSHAWTRRFGRAAGWTLIAVAPLAVWLILGAGDTGRRIALHPITRAQIWEAFYTVSGWLHVPTAMGNGWRLLVWLMLAGWIAVVVWAAHRQARPMMMPAFVKLTALFAASYVLVLIVSVSLFDANTPLDDRILSPLLAAVIVGIVFLASETVRVLPRSTGTALVAAAGLLIVTIGAVRTGTWLSQNARDGIGFSSTTWRESETLRLVRDLPVDVALFSNAPEPIYLYTGREATPFPRPRQAMSGGDNPAFAAELADMGTTLAQGRGIAVYFRTLPRRTALPEGMLRDELALRTLVEASDGALYAGNP
jgi:hypothetical protein